MILTQCAVCATELGLSLGKKCGRCSTRYCGPECQVQHWKEGGHDQLCKKIKKAGGAEQYNANNKYAEAVAAAVEECADDTKGQTRYICTEALHRHTKEGLVRECSCRGTVGFAHVSCLAEQAKILVEEALENNLREDKWERWYLCGLCKQYHHGVVRCALGWAYWKTYLGRPETDVVRSCAMTQLGNGLAAAHHNEDTLSVGEAELAMMRHLGAPEGVILTLQGNLSSTYRALGRSEEALSMRRDVYSGSLTIKGESHEDTLSAAQNYAVSLKELKRFEEAKSLLRKIMPVARRVLGENHEFTLKMRWVYAQAIYDDTGATLDDLHEAVTTLAETERTAQRVLGGTHPTTAAIEDKLQDARAVLSARVGPGGA